MRLVLLALLAAMPAAARTIPVYPGAVPVEQGRGRCCAFATRDGLDKVAAFYARALGKPALDAAALRKAYPELPQGAGGEARPLRSFVLEEASVPGAKGKKMPTQTFELVQLDDGRTAFEIREKDLAEPDQHFAHEQRSAHGTKSGAEQQLEEWLQQNPVVDPAKFDLPVYPGARVTSEQRRRADCWQLHLVTRDPYAKVVAFYREKLKGKLREFSQNGPEAPSAQWLDNGFAIADADASPDGPVVLGKKGATNRYVSVSDPAQGSSQTFPFLDPKTKIVREEPAVEIALHHAVLDEACVVIPQGARWSGEKPDPDGMYGVQLRE